MAVDLFDLVESLQRAVAAPGLYETTFPGGTEEILAGYLSDAFWNLRMLNMLSDYTESDGLVEQVNPSATPVDMPREMQSLVILFAAIEIITMELKGLETVFRVQGGPAEFEVQKSATLLKDVLAELQRRRVVVEQTLFTMGEVTDLYIDSVIARDEAQGFGGSWWVR